MLPGSSRPIAEVLFGGSHKIRGRCDLQEADPAARLRLYVDRSMLRVNWWSARSHGPHGERPFEPLEFADGLFDAGARLVEGFWEERRSATLFGHWLHLATSLRGASCFGGLGTLIQAAELI
jgi:hypothetical protein